MSIFPGSTPSFAGFTSSHTLAQDSHAAQHNSEQAEIIALANKIGIGSSTPASNLVLRGTDVGTSAWGQVNLTSDVTGVLPQANGGTGTTLATGTGKAVYDTSPTISGAQLTSSPTLTTPTIASFTNATHTHATTAQGGQIGTSGLQALAVTDTKLADRTIELGEVRVSAADDTLTADSAWHNLPGVSATFTTNKVNQRALFLVRLNYYGAGSAALADWRIAVDGTAVGTNFPNIEGFASTTHTISFWDYAIIAGVDSHTATVQYNTATASTRVIANEGDSLLLVLGVH